MKRFYMVRAIIAFCVSNILVQIGISGNEYLMCFCYLFLTILHGNSCSCLRDLRIEKIRNDHIRKEIGKELDFSRDRVTFDYTATSIAIILAILIPDSWNRITVNGFAFVDIRLFVIVLLALSMICHIHFYRTIHKFQLDIENWLSIEEEEERHTRWVEMMERPKE